MARTARQISNLVIDEISLVDKGANQHAVVTIAKNANGGSKENEMDIFDEQGNPLDVAELDEGDVVYDEEGNAYSMEFDDSDDEFEDEYEDDMEMVGKSARSKALQVGMRGRTAGRRIAGAGRRVRDYGTPRPNIGAATRPAPSSARQAAQTFETRLGDLQKPASRRVMAGSDVRNAAASARTGARRAGQKTSAVAGNTGNFVSRNRNAFAAAGGGAATGAGGFAAYDYNRNRVGKSVDFADEVREELSKALTDRDREEVITKALGRVDEMAQEMEIAKALAQEERELRIEREYTEIAKSYNLPFADEDLGRVLMHAAEALPDEDNAIIHKAFAAAGEAVFEEYGLVGGGDNADVYSQVEAAIDGMVTKSGVTREEALAEFFYENPDAYDEYLSER